MKEEEKKREGIWSNSSRRKKGRGTKANRQKKRCFFPHFYFYFGVSQYFSILKPKDENRKGKREEKKRKRERKENVRKKRKKK